MNTTDRAPLVIKFARSPKPPMCFNQVNQPLIDSLHAEARAMLQHRDRLLHAVQTVLLHLAPDGAGYTQHKLYSDCMHPTDDDKTIVDFLREAITKNELDT